jgi:TolA-binding protein
VGRRLTRKQIKHDEFVTLVDRTVHWLTGNWRQAVIGLGGAAAVAVLWWGIGALLHGRSTAAADALAQALATYNAPVGSKAPADAKLKFATDAERLAAAEREFQEVASHYWLSTYRREARLYLARIAADRGDTTGAIRMLTALASRKSSDPVVRLAMLDLIHLRLAKGEGQGMVSELEAMVAGKDPRLPPDVALYQLAQVWEREGKFDEANKLYRKLVEDYPDSPYRADAQQRLAAAG